MCQVPVKAKDGVSRPGNELPFFFFQLPKPLQTRARAWAVRHRHSTAGLGTAWRGVMRHGRAWHGMAWLGTARHGMAQHSRGWHSMARHVGPPPAAVFTLRWAFPYTQRTGKQRGEQPYGAHRSGNCISHQVHTRGIARALPRASRSVANTQAPTFYGKV